jgi:large subunit ribosomal protein L20
MPRVKRGVTARARHKKVLAKTKGFRGRRGNVYRVAKEAVMKAGSTPTATAATSKRDFRALWIQRINAAVRELGMSYSAFMAGLKKPRSRSTARCSPTWRCSTSPAFAKIAGQIKASLSH